MGILRSVALGKSRKSAGELTFYQRIGVPCFRQKPAKSPGYKSSVPQRMQQSVFRFMKANMDAANLKAYIDLFYDAKPRKGKSETKMNMFYRAFMPHMVQSKLAIYELPSDSLVDPALFLGTPATNNDKLTNGQLGDLVILSGEANKFAMSNVALDQIIAKANTLISTSETPFTTDNVFVGLIGADPTSPTKYKAVSATAITPTLADGVYSFDISAISTGLDLTTVVYVTLLIAGKDSQGDIDITRRKFATDSAKLVSGGSNLPGFSLAASAGTVGQKTFTISIPTAALTEAGFNASSFNGKTISTTESTTSGVTIGTGTTSGANTVFTCTQARPQVIATFSASTGPNAQIVDGETPMCNLSKMPAITWEME